MGSGVRSAVFAGDADEDVGATDFRPGLAANTAPVQRPQQTRLSYLLVPATEAGKTFGDRAKKSIAELQLVNVAGQADLMFCREQIGLRVEDLERTARARAATPTTS